MFKAITRLALLSYKHCHVSCKLWLNVKGGFHFVEIFAVMFVRRRGKECCVLVVFPQSIQRWARLLIWLLMLLVLLLVLYMYAEWMEIFSIVYFVSFQNSDVVNLKK